MSEALDPAELARGLAEAGVPWSVLCLDRCDSTNREARDRALADPALAGRGLAVFAGWQSAGRGRRGAKWHSEPESDLLFSVALRPPLAAGLWGRLTHAAAVAVCRALEPRFDAAVKWPNDIYLGGRKVSGILLESEAAAGLAVIGIGLNVNSDPDLADEGLAAPATSLRREAGGTDVAREPLAVALLTELHRAVGEAAGGFPGLRGEAWRRSALRDRDLSLTLPGGRRVTGRALGLGEEGELRIATPSGEELKLHSAEQVRAL